MGSNTRAVEDGHASKCPQQGARRPEPGQMTRWRSNFSKIGKLTSRLHEYWHVEPSGINYLAGIRGPGSTLVPCGRASTSELFESCAAQFGLNAQTRARASGSTDASP